ncbi:MICAL-like [Sergentomyia squamirostris]
MGERRGTKALELWCRRLTAGYPGVKIENMTTSWRDGLAFCAIIHHFRPDLIEFDKLDKNDIYYNNELAFRTAEIHLGIPALLDASDMESYDVPDRLSILTYLSQYYQVFGSQESSVTSNNQESIATNQNSMDSKATNSPKMISRGVLRREPCIKCKLPVFLAERLTIDGRVYHRTCLRCARCTAQLTPGSFYETEVDGDFCCEVCPDEEKNHRIGSSYKEEDAASVSSKGSLSSLEKKPFDKLPSFMKKSVSDEEKRESLERMNQDQKSMMNFMQTQIVDDKQDMKKEEENAASSFVVVIENPIDKKTVESSDIQVEEEEDDAKSVKIVDEDVCSSDKFADSAGAQDDVTSVDDSVNISLGLVDDKTKSNIVPPCEVSSSETPVHVVTKEVDNANENPSDEKVEDDTPHHNVPAFNDNNTSTISQVPVVEIKSMPSDVKDDAKQQETTLLDEPQASDVVPELNPHPLPRSALNTKKTSAESKEEPTVAYPAELNPFDSDDNKEEISRKKVKNLNPFDSDDEETGGEKSKSVNPFGTDASEDDSLTFNPHLRAVSKRTPVPTPRKSVPKTNLLMTPGSRDVYGSCASLNSTISARGGELHGSMNSLSSSSTAGGCSAPGTVRHKKGKAPVPPTPQQSPGTSLVIEKTSTPKASPRSARKKRPAPAPPTITPAPDSTTSTPNSSRMRVIPLDTELMSNNLEATDVKPDPSSPVSPGISFRRKIVPLDATSDEEKDDGGLHERQLVKLKDNKDSKNRNRRSHISYHGDDIDQTMYSDKSCHGKWKKRKGPAPALPVPPKRVLEMLPMQEILHELEVIEVQQQGLEKQGIKLEKLIREKCEGDESVLDVGEALSKETLNNLPIQNTKEVEDLIMQLFELVNEKNELFRRQAELMYLRRQHRLEQEQIDLEYEIRVLMAQPEKNKTDSDKAKEEGLISRLVQVVQLRNDVIDNLESDRLREAEEDLSIKQEIEKHTARRDEDFRAEITTKLSKKEKKKQKEAKKLKNKKIDMDKDDDETESSTTTIPRDKKKKKKFIII